VSAEPVSLVRIDPGHPGLRLLTPFLAERVAAYAAAFQPEYEPEAFARTVLARLWQGDPTLLAVGLVRQGSLVGHVLAEASGHGARTRVVILQVRADENVGDARQRAVRSVLDWAAQVGASRVILTVHRDPKDWADLGFRVYRHVLQWVPTGPAEAPPAPDEG
jgi:hypothetical protein